VEHSNFRHTSDSRTFNVACDFTEYKYRLTIDSRLVSLPSTIGHAITGGFLVPEQLAIRLKSGMMICEQRGYASLLP
jgi:hypothetical protein